MSDRDKLFLVVVAMYFIGVFVGWSAFSHNTVRYDCRLAEVSVDYPAQVKEKCRRLLEANR